VVHYRSSAKFDKQASVILINKDQIKNKKFAFNNTILKNQINVLVKSNYFTGENGQIFPFLIDKKINLLVGIGSTKDLSLTALRITIRKALLSPSLNYAKEIEIVLHDKKDQIVKAVIEFSV